MPSLSSLFGGGSGVQKQTVDSDDFEVIVKDALRAVSHIMEDDVDLTEKELRKVSSVYHKLGLGLVGFLKSTLGFERDVILDEAETAAHEASKQSQRGQLPVSSIYPPGMNYQLCIAEAQIMGSVVGILTESLTEAIKGFLKIRRAIFILQSIADAEAKFVKSHGKESKLSASEEEEEEEEEDDDIFHDAEEDPSISMDQPTHDNTKNHVIAGNLSQNVAPSNGFSNPFSGPSTAAVDPSLLTDLTEQYMHSGYRLHHGILLLLLSIIPPAFSRILSVVGFKGDRDRGISLLWQAAESGLCGIETLDSPRAQMVNNGSLIHGTMAGLVLLGWYDGMTASLDVVTVDDWPVKRCEKLLRSMQQLFPRSRLWGIESARFYSATRQLEKAVETLEGLGPPTQLKQMEAMRWFEYGLDTLYLHEYEKSAKAFIICSELNNWSQSLKYYIIGSCHLELYRMTRYGSNPDAQAAKMHAEEAEKWFEKVPESAGKKRFLAKPMPFDAFVMKKLNKWKRRADQWQVSLLDAVGVSPCEEIIYFWGGYRRMNQGQLKRSLEKLSFTDAGLRDAGPASALNIDIVQSKGLSSPFAEKEEFDEHAVLGLIRAVIYRQMGDIAIARTLLKDEIIDNGHTWPEYKEKLRDNWTVPTARYELAVCLWIESGLDRERPSQVDAVVRKQKLKECAALLDESAAWDSYELETRLGIKTTSAREKVTSLLHAM